MEKKISVDNEFYGENTTSSRIGCVIGDFCLNKHNVCSFSDKCTVIYAPPCTTAYAPPCSDSPCSDSPCSYTPPCSDTPSPTTSGSITSISATSDSIAIRYTSIPNAIWYQIHYRKDSESGTTPIANGSNLSCTITDLEPDTKYIVNYRGATATVFGPLMPTGKTIRTAPLYTEFTWTYSGINMSTGKPEYGARKKNGYGVYVTADEWNELVDNANERLGKSMGGVTQGTAISASAVNVLARALGVTTVSRGAPVGASFFNDLMDAVNSAG